MLDYTIVIPMNDVVGRGLFLLWACLLFFAVPTLHGADLRPQSRDPRVQIRLLTTVNDTDRPCRIAKDPRDQQLYHMTLGGTIYRLTIQPGENHSLSTPGR